jgi:hypothetical protein
MKLRGAVNTQQWAELAGAALREHCPPGVAFALVVTDGGPVHLATNSEAFAAEQRPRLEAALLRGVFKDE